LESAFNTTPLLNSKTNFSLSRPCFPFDLTSYLLPFPFPISSVLAMSTPARKRLMRDFKRLQHDPPAGISGAPQDNNIMLWNAVIFGPDDTPWDGGESVLYYSSSL
ncbi:hypothetical protein KIW84_063095, partial [Lathyrus oleraceus]